MAEWKKLIRKEVVEVLKELSAEKKKKGKKANPKVEVEQDEAPEEEEEKPVVAATIKKRTRKPVEFTGCKGNVVLGDPCPLSPEEQIANKATRTKVDGHFVQNCKKCKADIVETLKAMSAPTEGAKEEEEQVPVKKTKKVTIAEDAKPAEDDEEEEQVEEEEEQADDE